MLLPLNKPAVARLGQRISQRVVLQKGLQLRHVKAPNAAGHRTAQPQGLTRRTDSTQHAPQVLRFIALKHIHVVRHEHTGDAALAQCFLHGLGLHMGAHQHRHVARLHIRVLVQQRHHLASKALRHVLQMQWCSPMFAVGRRRQKPCGQGLVRLTACLQRLGLAAALHWLEFNLAQFGIKRMADAAKHMVDRCHQRGCGAEVAVQAVQRLGVDMKCFLSRLDVGAEVGPTETVDGLFGVANHDQRMAVVVRGMRVNSVQAFVLPRVGVLKFIDHGHRVLGADGRCHLAVIGKQSGVQALQQVLEIEDRQLQLGLLVLLAHLEGGVVEKTVFGSRFGFLVAAKFFDVSKHRVVGCIGPGFIQQIAKGEAGQNFWLDGLVFFCPNL